MNKLETAILVTVLGLAAPSAAAQSISPAWDAYRSKDKATSVPAAGAVQDPAGPSEPAQPVAAAPAAVPPPSAYPRRERESQSGFFVGGQVGKGWVYEDVDQDVAAINAGYRWQAGSVSLVGIEVAGGRLASTDHDGWLYEKINYGSVGANARFNFGEGNPWFAIARLGYWSADSEYGDDVDGGYASFGIGVDVSRHFNVNLMYTNYVYATTYYDYYDDDIEINRADMVTFGLEGRF